MFELGSTDGFLNGQLLIAMPDMGDPRFSRTVVYICAHSEEGAMGIIVNRELPDINFRELLIDLKIIEEGEVLGAQTHDVGVQQGGPVEVNRGFVLHSPDFFVEGSTLPIDEEVCLTATLDVLRAIARGRGPVRRLLALGYAGWGAGQLETEIQSNGWLHCQADGSILFDEDLDTKYDRALRKIGVAPGALSAVAGNA